MVLGFCRSRTLSKLSFTLTTQLQKQIGHLNNEICNSSKGKPVSVHLIYKVDSRVVLRYPPSLPQSKSQSTLIHHPQAPLTTRFPPIQPGPRHSKRNSLTPRLLPRSFPPSDHQTSPRPLRPDSLKPSWPGNLTPSDGNPRFRYDIVCSRFHSGVLDEARGRGWMSSTALAYGKSRDGRGGRFVYIMALCLG
jgi:hypothetical protein